MSHRVPLKPGSQIQISNDIYTIKRLISRGGTSLIYEATRPYCDSQYNLQLHESNEKKVILKELAPYDIPFERLADGSIQFDPEAYTTLRALFANEIQNIANIQRYNASLNRIPDMDAFGEYKGTVYIAMNHIKGELMSRFIKRFPMDEDVIMNILVNILDIMITLHQMDVPHYHLDLKPSNFIIGGLRHVYLFDFGSVLMEDATWIKNYTEHYSAPEVIYNEMSAIGPWSDIYSIGAILYEMITGLMPSFESFLFADGVFYEPKPEAQYDFNPMLEKMLNQDIHARFQSVEPIFDAIAAMQGRMVYA